MTAIRSRLVSVSRRFADEPVSIGFISAATLRLVDAVASARLRNLRGRVVLSTYLMAPGYFHALARNAGADLVTDPLLAPGEDPAPMLVDLVLDRYLAATGCV